MWVKTIQLWQKTYMILNKVISLKTLRSRPWSRKMQQLRTANSCASSHKSTLSNLRSNLYLMLSPHSTSTNSCQSWTRLKFRILCRLSRLLMIVVILWSTELPTITRIGFLSTWSSFISNACPHICARKRQNVELIWVRTTWTRKHSITSSERWEKWSLSGSIQPPSLKKASSLSTLRVSMETSSLSNFWCVMEPTFGWKTSKESTCCMWLLKVTKRTVLHFSVRRE